MKRRILYLLAPGLLVGILAVVLAIVPTLALASGGSFSGQFHTISTVASTVPANGDILTVNGNDGKIVETTPGGTQIAHKLIDKTVTPPGTVPGVGCLFGLAVAPGGAGVYFVDDCTNTLNILH